MSAKRMSFHSDLLLTCAGGLLALGAGIGIGWLLRDKKAKEELQALADEDQQTISDLIENYEALIEYTAEEKAKNMLLEAAQRRSKAPSSPVAPSDEIEHTSDSEAVESPSEPSESVSTTGSEVDYRPDPGMPGASAADYRPDPGVMVNRNAFDDSPDPSQAVDYTKMYQQDSKQEVVYGARMLQDDRTTTGFSKSKTDVREDLAKDGAKSDLMDWLESHTPEGYKIDGSGMEDPDEIDESSVLTEDEQAEADSEFDEIMRRANAKFQVITEDDYGCRNGYEKRFIMYCALDDTWCDEDLNVIEDPHVVYGFPPIDTPEYVFQSGEAISGDPERFWIRNNGTGTDYEVMRYQRAWQDMIEDPR